jgi:hypothetical protein
VSSSEALDTKDSATNEDNCGAAPTLDTSMMRSKSESRILQRPPAASPSGRQVGVTATSPRSLFEASALRIAKHQSGKSMPGQPDTDHGGIPDRFLQAYLAALRDFNIRWATESEVADLFADNAKLIGQDKQTTTGKTAVLRKLDQGVEMLLKMAGKDATVPEWEVKGPTLTEGLAHRYECVLKRGAFKISFSQEFLIVDGKIMQLRNSRS